MRSNPSPQQISATGKRFVGMRFQAACLVVCAVLFGLLFSTNLKAAPFTWDGGGVGGNLHDWAAKQNWGNVGPPGTGDDAIFTAVFGNSSTPTITGARAINSITYNASAAVFDITGTGPLTINGGGIVNNGSAGQTLSVSGITLGASQIWSAAVGNLTFSGATLALGANTLTVNGGFNTTINNQITGLVLGGLTKSGSGTLTLSAANTYSGVTTVSGGKLLVNNATGSGTGSGAVTVNAGGTLGGSGNVSGPVTLNSGSTISAGTSPGKLSTGSQIWNGGATNLFEINQAGGTEGINPGWDLLNITGGLTIAATSLNKFVIDIRSLTLANSPGNVSDFNNGLSYDWRIVTTTAGITGFDATAFELLLAGYSNNLGGGAFSLGLTNGINDLILHFNPAPVPEASTYLLMGFGLLMLGSAWRKRKA